MDDSTNFVFQKDKSRFVDLCRSAASGAPYDHTDRIKSGIGVAGTAAVRALMADVSPAGARHICSSSFRTCWSIREQIGRGIYSH
jgi:hypothetical protein